MNSFKYKVTLNYYGQLVIIYTVTNSPKKAVNNATYQLAQKVGKDLSFIRRYFNDKQNSYHVEEVITDDA